MIRRISKEIFSNRLPIWFKFLNLSILLPILFCPFIFYSTIFFFDNPKNLGLTYLIFFAVNAYPIYLVMIAYYNSRLFQKHKILGSILPSAILLTLVLSVTYIMVETSENISQSIKRETERTKQGYIGASNDYKIINDKVYRYDTLIIGADGKTFEMVSWDWQRDKNYYYRFGKRIPSIDRKSFQLLDYHYAKDKYHVYYDENIIEGADAETFYHIEGTQDGKDVKSCYRLGEKVDCKVLQTEE